MIDYREILRLNSLECNNTEIASYEHSSRGTVQNLPEVTSKMETRWPLDDVTNRVLQSLMYPDRYKKTTTVWFQITRRSIGFLRKKGLF